jgi:hypothetical protein
MKIYVSFKNNEGEVFSFGYNKSDKTDEKTKKRK